MFALVVLLLLGHMWGPIGVHHLRSSSTWYKGKRNITYLDLNEVFELSNFLHISITHTHTHRRIDSCPCLRLPFPWNKIRQNPLLHKPFPTFSYQLIRIYFHFQNKTKNLLWNVNHVYSLINNVNLKKKKKIVTIFFYKCKLYIVYSKDYFTLAEIFLLRLFKMVTNQIVCIRLEQMSVIKYLVAEKYKPCEMYGRMYDV